MAPALALALVLTADRLTNAGHAPLWWSGILALAWAPLLWLPTGGSFREQATQMLSGFMMVTGLSLLAGLFHLLPFGLVDRPDGAAGSAACLAFAVLYVCLAGIEANPRALPTWRRWSYAGFYLDEFYTRLALQIWPTRWTPRTRERVDLAPPIPAVAVQ